MRLQLKNPLVFFDLETTGLNVSSDRIVELSYVKLFPNGNRESKTFRINPEMHIPEKVSELHGIYDDDVKDCPTFRQIASEIVSVIEGCDLAGYNSNHFDIPLLAEELLRANQDIDLRNRKFVDAFVIFQKREPRNLRAAYRFYCDKELENAHTANADTEATVEVLLAQVERYEDLPNTIEGLSNYSSFGKNADFAGRLSYNADGEIVFNFGKYKGQTVKEVLGRDSGYYGWLMQAEFPQYTKNVITRLFIESKKK